MSEKTNGFFIRKSLINRKTNPQKEFLRNLDKLMNDATIKMQMSSWVVGNSGKPIKYDYSGALTAGLTSEGSNNLTEQMQSLKKIAE